MKALMQAGLLITSLTTSQLVWADAPNLDLIPELKDIEKIAAEQESAIRAQSDALAKSQQEKEAAEKAAKTAIDQQKALAATDVPPATATPVKPVTHKVTHKPSKKVTPPAPVDPWLAQERRYSFP